MATLSVPSPSLGSGSLGASIHRPLSTHGLPKQPRTMSPERPHRFSAKSTKSYPPPALVHTPMTPQSLGPMSPPPMSAKSFGTFIDSEPSTPAYSPRMDHQWDDSSVVLVRPMSSSSEPSSPTEPVWRMLQPLPVKAPPKPQASTVRAQSKEPVSSAKEISSQTSLSSHPTKQASYVNRPHAIKLASLSQQDFPPKSEDIPQGDVTSPQPTASTPTAAAFGKLANKMKLMLRRKNTNAKKKEKKKREYEEVDRIEDVHWTEM